MYNEDRIKAVNGKACVVTIFGERFFEPKVTIDALHTPSNGLAVVERDGKYGYINQTGHLIIPFSYESALPFSDNGLAFVMKKNGLGGYIDKENHFVIPPIYENGTTFRFNYAAVSKNGEYKYINQYGNQAIANTFDYAGGFSDCGLAKIIHDNEKHAFMDTATINVVEFKKGVYLSEFKDGSRLTKFRNENGKEAVVNAAGDVITGFMDQVLITPYTNRHPFLYEGYWGYLDNRGEIVIPNIYEEVSKFGQDEAAYVKQYDSLAKNNLVGMYIDENGEETHSPLKYLKRDYLQINRFKKGMALAVPKSKNKIEFSKSNLIFTYQLNK